MTLGPDSILLTGRVALVTGAAMGIGRATALALARFGADLAICDREAERMEAVAEEIRSVGRSCTTAHLDVRQAEAVAGFLHGLDAVDILVNNAGGTFFAPFLDVSAKGQQALIDENFTSVTHFIRGVVPLMPEGGSIVNVTSIEAHRAGPGFAVYSAMKAAVESLTKSLALELADRGIRVNAIAPDMIPTEGDEVLAQSAQQGEIVYDSKPLPWGGTPDDCAAAAVFLASPMARFITGTTVHVDGGNDAARGWHKRADGTYAP